MIRLQSFILGKHVVGGLWPELLDALSWLPTLCDIKIPSHWGDELDGTRPFILRPRTTELLFRGFSFHFPLLYGGEGGDEVKRRSINVWRTEVYNVRSIIQATKTLKTLVLPGEILRSMEGSTWSSLTHLVLEGFWPSDDNNSDDYLVAGDLPPAPPEPDEDSDTEFVFFFSSAARATPAAAEQPDSPSPQPALPVVPTDEIDEPSQPELIPAAAPAVGGRPDSPSSPSPAIHSNETPAPVASDKISPPKSTSTAKTSSTSLISISGPPPSELLPENEDLVEPTLAPEAATFVVSTSPGLTSPVQISSASSTARAGPLSPEPPTKTPVDAPSEPLSENEDPAQPSLDVEGKTSFGATTSVVLTTADATSDVHTSSASSTPRARSLSPELSSKTSVDMPSEKEDSIQPVLLVDVGNAAPNTTVDRQPPQGLPALSRPPILTILESMPNLQILDLKLVNHVDDEDSTRMTISGKGLICSASGPSVPTSPTEFLRHLVQFQVTCLDPDDHVLEHLPAGLQYLSLPRLPYKLEFEMLRAGSSPELVLKRLKQGHFSSLKTLRLWYNVGRPADLEDEKELIDFLPSRFPALQQLELCRRWDHDADSLKGRWDPLPVACALVSQLKELRMFKFDPDLPGIAVYLPFTYRTKRYHETIGRLHVS
uniref:F-box domain-containing protein n=1 Tax=Mycena chlorophos TaxID=658473 RepID=A0ABQ0LBT9_MYCCL|nr:predicted protein [Mycena chlorophos]